MVDVERHEPRYRLLEPFREYAREKLKARGEQGAVAKRHAFAYRGFAERYAVTRGDRITRSITRLAEARSETGARPSNGR